MITSRYTPKAIIYDVLYGFDLAKGDNHKYLDWLKIYYDYNGVDSVFWNVDKTEKYKMLSYMYRYNSKILQIIGDNLTTIREENKGYRPTDIIMDYEPQIQNEPAKYEIDSLKLYYIEKLIKECKKKHIQLIFSLSPFYGGSKYIDKDYAPLFKLMEKYKISFIDHYSDPDFIHNKLYFEDSYHMNRNGATAFSKKIAHELKQIIKSNEK